MLSSGSYVLGFREVDGHVTASGSRAKVACWTHMHTCCFLFLMCRQSSSLAGCCLGMYAGGTNRIHNNSGSKLKYSVAVPHHPTRSCQLRPLFFVMHASRSIIVTSHLQSTFRLVCAVPFDAGRATRGPALVCDEVSHT